MDNNKYTVVQMREALSKVQNKINWKHPVNTIIDESEQELVTEAIIYFCGCVPTFTPIFSSPSEPKLWVQAVGYYAAVGA
jgi:hypothetical protein